MEATRRSPARDSLEERYGPTSGRPRGVVLVAGLVGLLGLVWLAWVVVAASTPDVQSSLTSYEVVDAHTVRAEVLVRMHSDDVRATCRLRAFDETHDVVGERSFAVRGGEGTTRRALRFRTEREATSVDLVGCTTEDQSRPR